MNWRYRDRKFFPSSPLASLAGLMFVVVQSLNHVWLFATPWTAACQLPWPSPSPGACSNSCPLSWWCHPTISSSIAPFSSCLQSFPESGSSLMSWLFESGGQRTGASASAIVLPMNIQGSFPLGLTGLISLLSKGVSRVFSSTTIWKHQFFSSQPSLWFKSHICTHYWKNYSLDYMDLSRQSEVSAF